MRTRAWRAYAVAGCLVVAGYLLVPGGVARDAVYVLTGLSSSLVICLAVRLHRPVRCAPWWCLAAGQLLWSCGDATYSWYSDVQHVAPFPSPADGLYLAAYVVFGGSFVLLLRGRQSGRDRDGLLDSTIFTVGFGLLSWVFILEPTASASATSTLGRTIGLAYPLADVLLFGLLVRLLTTPGGRTPAFRLLVAGGALLFLADTILAVLNLTSGYGGGALDLLWLASYVLWGAAALHPSMRSLSEPVPTERATLTRRRLVALTTAGLTSPGTLAIELLLGLSLDGWAVVISSVVLFLLVIARMEGLLSRVQAQAGELDALSRTDALTGLPNRRSADAELGRALDAAAAGADPVSVGLLDLDLFKLFNDAYGHQAGDRLLAHAALAWGAGLPHGSVLARYGGEEFLLVAPGLSTGACCDLLAQLRTATPAGQSFSAGVAVWDGSEAPEALVHRADVALYEAKRTGRDRVVVAAPVGVG